MTHPAETHKWDSAKSGSGRGICTCGWATGHYALSSDPDLDREFDEHLSDTRPIPPVATDELLREWGPDAED